MEFFAIIVGLHYKIRRKAVQTMNKKQIIGLVIATVLFIITGTASVFTHRLADSMFHETIKEVLHGGYTFEAPDHNYVAVVTVTGTIQEQVEVGIFDTITGYQHDTTLDYLNYLMKDDNNVGVLLYIDSPGGAVYESDELYRKVQEYQATGKPVWSYMAHYAASGGYYVTASADKIYANPNTTTGSIGVIMATFDMSGLYEKLGIRYVSIASGVNKDSSMMTDEQIEIYQSQVDEAYERFVEIIADGRGMDTETVKNLADGRTYTAKQALELDLIDEIGLYEDVKDAIATEAGTNTFYELDSDSMSGLAAFFGSITKAMPKSEAQVLKELADDKQGGLQYYANGLH